MMRITHVKALDGYRLEIAFADGIQGIADVSDLAGQGVFSVWDDYEQFKAVRIGDTGELIWGDQVDLCPDSLYLRITGKSPEDIFPSLKKAAAHA